MDEALLTAAKLAEIEARAKTASGTTWSVHAKSSGHHHPCDCGAVEAQKYALNDWWRLARRVLGET